jgi:hypothetical protein
LLLTFGILPASFAFQLRKATIISNLVPNGCFVPHPCDVRKAWCGIGYEDGANGAGKILDPFGVDLAANNYVSDVLFGCVCTMRIERATTCLFCKICLCSEHRGLLFVGMLCDTRNPSSLKIIVNFNDKLRRQNTSDVQ